MYGKKNNGPETPSENGPVGLKENADFEVFRNGELPKETIAKWLANDLKAVLSLVSGILKDAELNSLIVDYYYGQYKKMHEKDGEKTVD